jgi:PAS domain S-box-containing protein
MLAKKALEEGRPYAMAFVDIRMPPGWDGVETTQNLWGVDPGVQVVLCTAYADYSWDEMFEKIGNCDRLVILKKPFDAVEVLQLAHALTEKWWLHRQSRRKMAELESRVAERTRELQQTNDALRASQQMLEGIINAIPVRVFWKDRNLVYLGCNVIFARDAGFADPKDIIGKDDHQMAWRDQAERYRGDDRQVIESGCSKLLIEEPQTTPEGNTITLLSSKMPLLDSKGGISGLLGTYMDITERKRLEAQVFQSQKMETVGKLAGGIAHEFNSILTAIIGQSELLLGDLPPGSALAGNATEISKAASRAATLTRQLLAYGRKQFLQPETLDLNRVITSMEGMLNHLMGDDVDLRIIPTPGLRAVRADTGQIEQVVMNLAINARQAMPNGGKLTLETANVSFDQESVDRNPELKPGDYVMLAITDTGAGMSQEVKARAFEPFFSTKGAGQGTGLGLSTCYGIIKQSGGHISVYSEPARGATFKVYLPQVEQPTKSPIRRLDPPDLPRGTETILLVEDDPALREMAATLLRRLGYTILAAANGIEALSLKRQRDIGHIDLLFTDVVMPHMSGKELSERVRALYPRTRILFTSAYTENAIIHQGVLNKGVALLQKPFTPSALAHKLREVLDQPDASEPDADQRTFGFTRMCDGARTVGN